MALLLNRKVLVLGVTPFPIFSPCVLLDSPVKTPSTAARTPNAGSGRRRKRDSLMNFLELAEDFLSRAGSGLSAGERHRRQTVQPVVTANVRASISSTRPYSFSCMISERMEQILSAPLCRSMHIHTYAYTCTRTHGVGFNTSMSLLKCVFTMLT